MKRLTKVFALLLALTLMFALMAGCGSNANSSPSNNTPSNSGGDDNSSDAQDPAVTLKFSMNTSDTSMTGLQYKAFKELVEEESGGSITFEIYAAGSLVDDAGALDAVMDGTCDLAHAMVAYTDGMIKDLTPLEIPGYYSGDDFSEFTKATNQVLSDIYADYDIKFIGSNFQGQSGFVTTTGKKIDAPEVLKGQSVRAAGTYIAKAVEAWGGAPTTVSLADLTTALERKTVDSVYTGYSIIGGFKLYEMAPQVTLTTITESYAALIMNMDKWNSLTDNQKAAMERAAERWIAESYQVGMDFRQQYVDEMNDAGCEVTELDAAGTKPFTDLTASIFDELEGTLGEKGLELLSVLRELNG